MRAVAGESWLDSIQHQNSGNKIYLRGKELQHPVYFFLSCGLGVTRTASDHRIYVIGEFLRLANNLAWVVATCGYRCYRNADGLVYMASSK